MSTKRVLLLNGPNLNLLGRREPSIYGSNGLADIVSDLTSLCQTSQVELQHLQSNAEHELVERIQHCMDAPVDFIVINPAAFTHTSVAIRDALAAVQVPFVEVHLSNIYQREAFRKHSYLSDLASAVVSGMGAYGYTAAMKYALQTLEQSEPSP